MYGGESALLGCWAGNAVGGSQALQSVLGFEIDLDGNVWALDQGKVNGAAGSRHLSQQHCLIQSNSLSLVRKAKFYGSSTFPNQLPR